MATKRYVTYEDALALATEANGKYEAKDATIVRDASYVHTDNNFTTTEKTKLSNITTESSLTDGSNLPTGAAVKAFVEGKGYITNSDVAASIAAGIASALESMTWSDLEGE